MNKITVFNNYANTTKPKHFDVDVVLNLIKECKVQPQINEIRACENENKAKQLKKMLPCILFSGVFTERKDKSITEHSGFLILDWDNLTDVEAKKIEISKHPFIYACFVSPSGHGLKAVARVPAVIKHHRGYYRGLLKMFPELDASNINEGRICYASADANIYINKEATIFETFVEDKAEIIAKIAKIKDAVVNNYSRVEVALKIIRDSIDGEKHAKLLKASKLMGGFIAGGLIYENEAIRLLENEIQLKGCEDFKAAQITIKKGIDYGKATPIEQEEIKRVERLNNKPISIVTLEDDNFDFLADESEDDLYLEQWRQGTFQKGLTTGIPSLDEFFLFKRANFNVINGFDNVGKSTALWYFALLSAMYHGWKWIICSNENKNGAVKKKLIEFYLGIPINKQNDLQYNQAYNFIKKHFSIIKNDKLYSYVDILTISEKLLSKQKHDGILIDPYNSLKIDLPPTSKLSTHEYHYEAASEMQVFAKRNDICIYLNCHVITGSMRLKNGEKRHSAPSKADTEGGGKFSNKADDFMTFHREVQDKDNFTKMQIHVRKIKEVETGGGYTQYETPYILEMQKGMCSYADESGFDPIRSYWEKKNDQIVLPLPIVKPSTTFESEAKVYAINNLNFDNNEHDPYGLLDN